jgi:hypothetical protein
LLELTDESEELEESEESEVNNAQPWTVRAAQAK